MQDLLQLKSLIQEKKLPDHVAIVMDGNGRWAQKQKKNRIFGHQAGAKTVRKIVETSAEIGISYLTLYAFSEENWIRPETEIQGIFSLLSLYLDSEKKKLKKNNIRFKVIGRIDRLSSKLQKKIQDLEFELSNNTGLCLTLAISYGSRQEITQACQKIADQVYRQILTIDDITPERIESFLWTAQTPDPDLLIRTSGEQRLSNFLLWQIAYSEFCFVQKHWPEFEVEDYLRAIYDYQNRKRRYGAVEEMLFTEKCSF